MDDLVSMHGPAQWSCSRPDRRHESVLSSHCSFPAHQKAVEKQAGGLIGGLSKALDFDVDGSAIDDIGDLAEKFFGSRIIRQVSPI